MKASRLAKLALDVRSGFWLRPICMLAIGVGVGLATTRVDHVLIETGWAAPTGALSPGGARALLSVAAGALATTLAISLSMTMVTVQLASSQYTPRLVRRFLSDRFTQGVLGGFLATIAFQFLVLRAVRSPDEGDPFVPGLALSVAVLATVACLALLVVFLHRTMRSMQPSTTIASIGRETVALIEATPATALRPRWFPLAGPCQLVRADAAGYVQLLDDDRIRAALAPAGGAIRREANPGDFVLPGTPLVALFGGDPVSDEQAAEVRRGFTLGSQRTAEADCMFGVRQLVDVGLKALSPGINDVTTAVMVVNELGVIAAAVAGTGLLEDRERALVDERPGRYVIRDLSFERYLGLAFGEIVPAAADHPRVHCRILELLATVEAVVPAAAPLVRACAREVTAAMGEAGRARPRLLTSALAVPRPTS